MNYQVPTKPLHRQLCINGEVVKEYNTTKLWNYFCLSHLSRGDNWGSAAEVTKEQVAARTQRLISLIRTPLVKEETALDDYVKNWGLDTTLIAIDYLISSTDGYVMPSIFDLPLHVESARAEMRMKELKSKMG